MKELYLHSIEERCVILAEYIVQNNATVRATAQKFGISKSTVHKDVSKTLKRINTELYDQAQRVMAMNKSERHIRGGEATKRKYASLEA